MRATSGFFSDVAGKLGPVSVRANIIGMGASGGSGFGDSSSIVGMTAIEEPYGGQAEVIFDGILGDVRGSRMDLSWGYNDSLSQMQPYWVVDQQYISKEGRLWTQVIGANVWEMCQYSRLVPIAVDSYGSASPTVYEKDTPITDIIEDLLTDEGSFTGQWSYTYNGLSGISDGIVDSYQPLVRIELNTPLTQAIQNVLSMTAMSPLPKSDGIYLVSTRTAIGSANYTFQLDSTSTLPFYTHAKREGVVIPNRVYMANILPNNAAGQVATFVGVAENVISQGQIGVLPDVFYNENIESDAEAEFLAVAKLAQFAALAKSGNVYAPLHPGLELYDTVQVTDSRGGPGITARIGRIERVYKSDVIATGEGGQRATYSMHIQLGGILAVPSPFASWSEINGRAVGDVPIQGAQIIPAPFMPPAMDVGDFIGSGGPAIIKGPSGGSGFKGGSSGGGVGGGGGGSWTAPKPLPQYDQPALPGGDPNPTLRQQRDLPYGR